MRIIECIRNIMSLPKTLFLNFYYLPIKRAVRIPIRCCYNVKIHSLGGRNCVILLDDSARVRIGFSSSYGMGDKTIWTIEKGAKVFFLGGRLLEKELPFLLMVIWLLAEIFFVTQIARLYATIR